MATRSRKLEVVFGGDPRPFQRAASQVDRSAGRMEGRLSKLGGVATKAFAGLSVGAGLGIGAMVKAGVDFEKQMARVQGVSSATGKEMQSLNDLAKQLGADTKFSAGEAAGAMYELASAGFKVGEMSKVLPGTLSLAAASGIELKDAAEISANALRGFGLRAQDIGHVGDVLAKAVNSSSVEMRDLQLTMKYIGPIAKTTGQSFEDMIAAVSLMGNAGIKGEQAGTTLRGALTRLTNPTKMVQEGMKELGLAVSDFQGPKGLLPLPQIIANVSKASEGMDRSTRNAALASIFGTEALSGMAVVVDAGEKKLRAQSRALKDSEGAAKKAADTMNDTVAGAWDAFTGSVETASISLYEKFSPALKDVLKSGAEGVNSLADLPEKLKARFGLLRDAIRSETGKKGGVGYALGTMLREGFDSVPWGEIGDKIAGGLRSAFNLAPALRGAVTAGITAAVAGIDGEQLAGGMLRVVGEMFDALSSPSFWADHWKDILTIAAFVIPVGRLLKLPGVTQVANFLGKSFSAGLQFFGRSFTGLMGRVGSSAGIRFLAELEDIAPRTARFLLGVATGSPRRLVGLVTGLGNVAGRAVNAVADKLGEGIGKVAGVVAKIAAAGVRKMASWLGNWRREGGRLGTAIVGGALAAFSGLGQKILDKIKSAWGWVKGKLPKFTVPGAGVGPVGDGLGLAPSGNIGGLMGANPMLGGVVTLGRSMGTRVVSGLRPGSITSSGNISYHSTGEAVDLGGSMQAMRRTAVALRSRFGSRLAELITPWANLDLHNGRPHTYSAQTHAEHSGARAHVHAAIDLGRPGVGIGDGIGRMARRMGDGLGAAQKRVAQTIAQVGQRMGATRQQMVAAFMAALVESNLRNLNYGDRDSLGVFQQRPSQGWGTPAQIRNVEYAARKFFERAMRVGSARSAGRLAQAVQRSAFPGRYDERRAQALEIFRATTSGSSGGAAGPPSPARRATGGSRIGWQGRSGWATALTAAKGAAALGPLQYDYATAQNELALARAERTTGDTGDDRKARQAQLVLLAQRRREIKARMAKITRALRKRGLRPETRRRLMEERTELVRELGTVGGAQAEAGAALHAIDHPATAEQEEPPWVREQIEAQERAAEAAREQAEAQNRLAEQAAGLRAEMKRVADNGDAIRNLSMTQLAKGLADFVSGQIAGPNGAGGRAFSAGDGATLALYKA